VKGRERKKRGKLRCPPCSAKKKTQGKAAHAKRHSAKGTANFVTERKKGKKEEKKCVFRATVSGGRSKAQTDSPREEAEFSSRKQKEGERGEE